MDYSIHEKLPYCRVGFVINDQFGNIVFTAFDTDADTRRKSREEGQYTVRGIIPEMLLNDGNFYLSPIAGIYGEKNLVLGQNTLQFQVIHRLPGIEPDEVRPGVIAPELEWHTVKHS